MRNLKFLKLYRIRMFNSFTGQMNEDEIKEVARLDNMQAAKGRIRDEILEGNPMFFV